MGLLPEFLSFSLPLIKNFLFFFLKFFFVLVVGEAVDNHSHPPWPCAWEIEFVPHSLSRTAQRE